MVKIRDYELIAENVFVLYDKMFQLYIVEGERKKNTSGGKNVLIDSGVTAKAGEFYQRINQVLADAENKAPKIDTLLLTHSHWDHAGAASWLQEKYRFNVIASHRAAELLQKDKVVAFIDRLNQDYKKMVNDTSDTAFEKLENIGGVAEGDTIPIGGDRYFKVIDTPGHTKCSISYLLMPERILFPGDASGVIEQNGPIKPLFLSSYKNYENSIKKLLEVDAPILALPHNRLIKGKDKVRKHLEGALSRTREVKASIVRHLKEETDVLKIAEAIYKEEFPYPTLMGPREALTINLEAMIKSIQREFPEEMNS